MDKLKYIRLENPDGSYSPSIPLAIDSNYVDVNGKTLTEEIAKKVDTSIMNNNISNLQTQINSLASGSPAEVYATVAALTAADPNHSKTYVVTADGHWYYYNSGWQDGGVYQSTSDHVEIEDIRTSYNNFLYTSAGQAVREGDKNNINKNNFIVENLNILNELDSNNFYTFSNIMNQTNKQLVFRLFNNDSKNGWVQLSLYDNLNNLIEEKSLLINSKQYRDYIFEGYFSVKKIKINNINNISMLYFSCGYSNLALLNSLEETLIDIYKISNLELIKNTIESKYINNVGEIGTNVNSKMYSLPVKYKQSFKYSNNFSGWCSLWGYEENGTPHKLIDDVAVKDCIITIPENVIIIRWFDDVSNPSSQIDFFDLNYDINKLIDVPSYNDLNSLSLKGKSNIEYTKTNKMIFSKTNSENSAYINLQTTFSGTVGSFGFIRFKVKSDIDTTFSVSIFTTYTDIETQKFKLEAEKEYEIYFASHLIEASSDYINIQFQALDDNTDPTITISDVIFVKDSFNAYKDLNSKITLKDFNTNTFIVDRNGKGHFIYPSQACKFINNLLNPVQDDYLIKINEGHYEEWTTNESPYACISKGANKISIIGENRDKCIISCVNTSQVQSRIMDIGGPCTIANLTLLCLKDETYTVSTDLVHNCYCIHVDRPFETEEKYETVIENCYLYSECHSPLGAGLQNNQIQKYKNNIFISNGILSNGSLYVHSPFQNSGATYCEVWIENNSCISKDETVALSMENAAYTPVQYTNIPCTLQRNILYTNGETVVNNNFKTTHLITPYSALNNNELLNYTLNN